MANAGKITTVTIIGAGSGGFGLLIHLGRAGYRVRLHDLDDQRLEAIRDHGGVDVENGAQSFVPVELATVDLRASVGGADLIIVVTGGNTHATVAHALAPLLCDGQIILLIQGNTGGSLIVRQALQRAGCRATIDVAEMDTYPYATARPTPTRARLVTQKRWLQIAAFPGNRGSAVMEHLRPLFPDAVLAPNILYTGLTNMNAVLHVANCLSNAGRIESGGAFKFYAEGVTPAVVNLYNALDVERLAIATQLGATTPSLADWIHLAYGIKEATLPETFYRLTYDPQGAYQNTPSPTSLAHKYISEDVPTGLIPIRDLGAASGVATPTLDALIHLACLSAGHDFVAEARTLDRLGLAGQDAAQIQATVRYGFA